MNPRARIWVTLTSCATLALFTLACGGGTPSSPTTVPGPASAVAGVAPTPIAPAGSGTTTWACFTASSAGIFSADATCARAAIGAARVNPTGVPFFPSNLTGSASGSTVTLDWTLSSGDPTGPPTSFVVEAGSSLGSKDLASFDTGDAKTTLTVTGVPAGTYFVRVRTKNASGVSGPSNDVTIIVGGSAPCATAPGAPTGLSGASDGSTVNLAWSPPSGGCAATSYVLEAGSAPGSSNLASFNTGSTATQYSAAGVAAGTYYVRVRAANAAGNSAVSNEVIVTVGGSTPTGVSGTWIGLVANGDGTSLNSSDCGLEKADWRLDLTQTGSAVTGTLTQKTVMSRCDPAGLVKTAAMIGTVSSSTFTFAFADNPSRTIAATFTASRMTGSSSFAGTFALNRQ